MLAREQTLLRGAPWRVLAGINCAESDYRALERLVRPGIALERSRDDFTVLLGKCALSISQAGYNTVAETLQTRVHAVLVPFAGGGESEQRLRAQLLAERGAACMADEETLSPETLAEAVNRAVRAPLPPTDLVDLDGARRSAARMNVG
jgi:predicted glycosyltransferase